MFWSFNLAYAIVGKAEYQMSEEKLTTSQFEVLEALFHLGPLVQRDLANKLLVGDAGFEPATSCV